MRTLLCCVALAVVSSTAASAQDPVADARRAPDLTGEWNVRWASAVRAHQDGSVEIQGWGDALLTFVQSGDSVTGTWTTSIVETVRWTLAGTLQEGRLLLTATTHDSDDPELEVIERIVWRATFEQDRIEGHLSLQFRGKAREPARRPFTAERSSGS